MGDTNTGKSTLVDIVAAMFAPNSVGVVDSSHETIFGLQSMHEKELIVSPEMPDNMAQQLASDKFKKMVCGEIVAVPIKHAVAETVKWRVPMLMCSNDYPRYRDERGSGECQYFFRLILKASCELPPINRAWGTWGQLRSYHVNIGLARNCWRSLPTRDE